MRALVTGMISFLAIECPPKMLEKLRRDLSFPNPDYITRLRLGHDVDDLPARIECMEQHPNGLVQLPRGAVGLLRERADEHNLPIVFVDERRTCPSVSLKANVQLRPYQQSAVDAMCRGVQGLIVVPCGGGKTVIGTAAIAKIGQPALVIVHTRDLLEQWRESIRSILGIEPGVISEGKCNPDIVTIATVQTLVQQETIDDIGSLFGCVIVDESHHSPCTVFRKILSRLPARYRFGLTATPYREDGLTRLIHLTLGKRLYEVDHQELLKNGYLELPEIRPVQTGFRFPYNYHGDYQRCLNALVTDPARNALVVDLAFQQATAGHTVLVLSNRVSHCRKLARALRKRGVSAEALVGPVKPKERTRILSDFKAGKLSVVTATTIADEGLDVPTLDRVVLAFPTRAKGRTVQRLGRLMRPHPDKQKAVLFDLVDGNIAPFARQYRRRRKVYTSLGLNPCIPAGNGCTPPPGATAAI